MIILVSVTALIVWLYSAPYRVLNAIRLAAEAGDSERLSELVDFGAVRESLREQVNSALAVSLAHSASSSSQDDPYAAAGAAFGVMLGQAVVDRLVETFVSPSAIAGLASGRRPSTPPFAGPGPSPTAEATFSCPSLEPKITSGYDSASRFSIHFGDRGSRDDLVTLVLRRRWFSWRLTSIRLPALQSELQSGPAQANESVQFGPLPNDYRKFSGHPSKALQDSAFAHAFGELTHADGVPSWIRQLNVVGSGAQFALLGGEPAIILAGCRPHFCGEDYVVVIYRPERGRAVAAWRHDTAVCSFGTLSSAEGLTARQLLSETTQQ